MSIEVWVSYRTPLSRLNEAVTILHAVLFDKSYSMYESELLRRFSLAEESKRTEIKREFDIEVMEDSKSTSRAAFAFEAELTIRIHDEHAYIIPRQSGWMEYIEDDLMPDWIEDYHYQNQVDAPEPLPDNWKERAEFWGYGGASDQVPLLYHTVCKPIDYMGLHELSSRFIKEHPRKVSPNE